VLAAEGPGVMAALVSAMYSTCPRQTLRALSGALYTLLSCPLLASAAGSWLGQAVQQQLTQAAAEGPSVVPAVSPETAQRFLSVALRQPLLPRGRFDALVTDMAGIARSEESADALLGYEM
jgi:hypothetical protein